MADQTSPQQPFSITLNQVTYTGTYVVTGGELTVTYVMAKCSNGARQARLIDARKLGSDT
jgi:hypothetical protein